MRTYRPPPVGPGDQEDQVNRELAGSALLRTAKSVVAGTSRQGRVPRLEQSTQLHTNPSQPPVHSRLLPRPPHCRTGPLPLATPLVCTVRKLPRIHPPSPSPCPLPPQGSRVRLFGLSTTLLLLVSPTDRVLSSCTIFPFFSSYPLRLPAHYHSSYSLLLPFRPPPETLPPLVFLSPSRRRIIQPIHSFVQAARMVSVFITCRPRNVV